jgi:hypothetical protein
LQFEASLGLVHQTLSQKIPSPKRAGGVAQGIDPKFKPRYLKKKKKRKKERNVKHLM